MKAADGLEVCVVHVCIHTEQAFEDGADDVKEVGGEGCPKLLGKYPRIIDLHPNLPSARLASGIGLEPNKQLQKEHCMLLWG